MAYNLIEDMTKNHNLWGKAREKSVKAHKKDGLCEVSQFEHMKAKVDALYQNLKNLTLAPSTPAPIAFVAPTTPETLYCEVYGLNWHSARDCQMILIGESDHDTVNYANN